MLLRMAWRNLWRNPRRTAVALTAISVGIAGCVLSMAINLGMVAGMVDTAIRSGLAHLQVHASGWDKNPELEVRLFDGGAAVTRALDGVAEIEYWAPRLRAQGLVASPRASVGVAIAGVDPAREVGVSVAADSLVAGDWLGEPRRLVLGNKLAARLEVDVGSKVVLSVQDLAGELTGQAFRVGGLLRAGSRELDDGVVFMRLGDAQALLGMGDAISEIAVVTFDRGNVSAIREKLEATLGTGPEVRTWEQLEPLLVYMVDTFDSMAWVIYAAVFIAMAFGIANVLLMSVYERAREIGMMRAVGMSRARVVAMVVLESTFVTALGLLLGVMLALLGIWLLADGVDISAWAGSIDAYGIQSVLTPALRARDLVAPVLIGAITAVLSSFWPALRAARATPADALRQV
ncbi:MAG: ABC transporter permease [bacterium]|nr:ABC transporter permease [bacterium]